MSPHRIIAAWKVFFSDIVKAVLAILAALFYLEPALALGLIVCFVFNVLAGIAKGLIKGDRFARHLLRTTARRALVYLIVLPPAIVISNMVASLQVIASLIFAGVAVWEFITASAIAAYIYEPWREMHNKIADMVHRKADMVPNRPQEEPK